MSLVLADISEWQDTFDAGTYLKAGHTCIIIRAHTGYRIDHKFAERRNMVRGHQFDAVGYYHYLVEDRNPGDQARLFIEVVGPLEDNEFAIVDSEEGSGIQISRVETFCEIVDNHYGRKTTLYASESWFAEKLEGAARWRRPRWMAAYQSDEPSDPHELWQNTNRSNLPGISGDGGDGNIFHGTGQEFRSVFCGSGSKFSEESDMIASVRNKDGRQERFVALHNGVIKHNWQDQNYAWQGWVDRGNVGGTPLGISANLNVHDCVEVCVYLSNGEVLSRWQTAPGNGWSDHWSGAGHPGT